MPIDIDPNTGAPIVTGATTPATPTSSFVAADAGATDKSDPSAIPPTGGEGTEKDTAKSVTLEGRIDDAKAFNATLPTKASAVVTSVQNALNPETINHPDERVQEIHKRMKEIRDEYGGQVSDIPVEKGGEYWVLRDELRALLNP